MTEVRFYHLLGTRLEQALPEIVAKAIERKMRVVVKAGSRERVEALDGALWAFDAGSFLPHGYIRDGMEKDQPVWLTENEENPNGANVLILTDGAASENMMKYSLCCEIFDGRDEQAVVAARTRWKQYKEQGHTIFYYQQDEAGKWQLKQ